MKVLRRRVPPGAPAFRGHFPGRPVLPAVAQIALVLEALGEPGAVVTAIPDARFRRALLPDEELEVRVSAEGPLVRFEILAGGAPASRGTLEVRRG